MIMIIHASNCNYNKVIHIFELASIIQSKILFDKILNKFKTFAHIIGKY